MAGRRRTTPARNRSPTRAFLLGPATEVLVPTRATIVPEMEINVKLIRDDPPSATNLKTHTSRGDRESKVPILEKGDVEARRHAAQASMQSKANRGLREMKSVTAEDSEEKKGARRGRGGMVNRGGKGVKDEPLELSARGEVLGGDELTKVAVLIELNQLEAGPHRGQTGKRRRAEARERWGGERRTHPGRRSARGRRGGSPAGDAGGRRRGAAIRRRGRDEREWRHHAHDSLISNSLDHDLHSWLINGSHFILLLALFAG
ncbi:hypothetical protein GUJ93_ZPchr0010g10577 [Zizania palustris]|uniref:Uncharacterized protein n=1 Tax=Zizania palustris TaxID=103762 RepID=A0A8J5WF40_ZIZPA|nr:hypothetical protein GUJ93_ZPchr0010g10577 [Zizania palustris]